MRDRLVGAVHNAQRQDIVQKFRIKVVFAGRRCVNDGASACVAAQFHGNLARFAPRVNQARLDHGQEFVCHVTVHKAYLACVANRGTAGFCVVQNMQCHVKVSTLIHVYMADARTRLNAGHGGVFNAGADQPRTASGNQHIHVAVCLHQVGRALARGVLNQVDKILAKPRICKTLAQSCHNGGSRQGCIFTGAQYANAARFDGKRGCIRGDIGAAFVNDGDHTHGRGDLAHGHAVGAFKLRKHVPQGGGQRNYVQNALRHRLHAPVIQAQSVQHDVGDTSARRL